MNQKEAIDLLRSGPEGVHKWNNLGGNTRWAVSLSAGAEAMKTLKVLRSVSHVDQQKVRSCAAIAEGRVFVPEFSRLF